MLGVRSGLHIQQKRPTLASMLKNAGYNTAAIGKWHLGYQEGNTDYYKPLSPGPQEIGFDYHWGVPSNHGDITGVWIENKNVFGLVEKMEDLPLEQRQPEFNWKGLKMLGIPAPYRKDSMEMSVITKKAVDWIHNQSDKKPFFLYFAQTAIHVPLKTSPAFVGSSAGGAYGDFIQELDHSVGEILKALDDKGFSENTLVLFTSDNGGHPAGAQQAVNAGLQINGKLRGTKLTIWDGGFKVPYIVHWPGRIPAGTKSGALVSLVDTYTTIATLIGEPLPDKDTGAGDSFNVLPAWMAEPFVQPLRKSIVLTSFEGITALRWGKWKYVEGIVADPDPQALTGKRLEEANEMLYSLGNDPNEKNDVLNNHPRVVDEMKSIISRIRKQGHSQDRE